MLRCIVICTYTRNLSFEKLGALFMEKNMTQGSPWKHILLFSLPILGGMMLQLLYTTVDGIVVGNVVGETALGAMNTSVSYANLLLAVSTGLSTGCGIVMAQFFGAANRANVRLCSATMRLLMTGLGVISTILGLLTTDLVLQHILGVPEDVFSYASDYMKVYFLGMVFQFAYNTLAAELRSIGDSGSTMLFLLISSVANIILDLIFVMGLQLGVAGAALGTVLAQAISVVVSLLYIHKKHDLLALHFKDYHFSGQMCGMILRLGIPVMLQTVISNLGMVAIQRLINSFGSAVMAGVAAGNKVESYAIMPNIAFASGMATYAGQNAGAGDLKRVWRGYLANLVITGIICGTLSLAIYLFATPLVTLFGCTGAALTFGIGYLRFMACVLIIMTVLFITRGMLQGIGDVSITTVITFVTLALRIALAYWMASWPSIGPKAIYICMGIDFGIGSVLYLLRLLSGRWKKKILIKSGTPIL